MVCLSPVGHAKHHIPQATNIPYQTLLIKPIFSVLACAEKVFFKTSLRAFAAAWPVLTVDSLANLLSSR